MLLDEIADYISVAGFGTVGTNIFKGELPATPINCTAIYESFGQETMSTMELNIAHEFPELHVLVRHTTAVAARARCSTIMEVLARVKNMYLGGTFYLTINPRTTPYPLQPDENKNHLIVCRFQVMKVKSEIPLYTF